jgi:hypothetical protein
MAGLVPAIHVLTCWPKDVDARHRAGHDGGEIARELGIRSGAAHIDQTETLMIADIRYRARYHMMTAVTTMAAQ